MGHRSLVDRFVIMVAICLPVASVAASGPGALAASSPAGAVRSARVADGGGAAFAAIRAAGRKAAPWVADSGLSATKTGLAAPRMSSAMRRANAEKQSIARSFLARMRRQAGSAGQCAKRPCRAGRLAARNLKPTQRRQITNYFCGPATVTEMLAQMHVELRQRQAARELGTTLNGTAWSDSSGYPVPRCSTKTSTLTIMSRLACPGYRTASELRTYERDLVADINHGRGAPLAGDAYEVPGGPHLVGHPAEPDNLSLVRYQGIPKFRGHRRTMRIPCTVRRASAGAPPSPRIRR